MRSCSGRNRLLSTIGLSGQNGRSHGKDRIEVLRNGILDGIRDKVRNEVLKGDVVVRTGIRVLPHFQVVYVFLSMSVTLHIRTSIKTERKKTFKKAFYAHDSSVLDYIEIKSTISSLYIKWNKLM